VDPPRCAHIEVVEGRCAGCGECVHEVILNGACYHCRATELAVTVEPVRQTAKLVPAERLRRSGKRD
jgi:flavoprotein